MNRLAVMIPAHNEAQRVGEVIDRVRGAIPDSTVFVVDSGSTDDTAAIAAAHGATVISQGSSGYGGALQTGYAALLQRSWSTLVQLDGDGQHPPEAIPDLLRELNHADFVVASREGTDSQGAWHRRLGNAGLSWAVFGLTGQRFHDVTSGMWALDRAAVTVLAEQLPTDTWDAGVRVLAHHAGLEMREVPVEMSERQSGESMHDGWSGPRHFFRSLRTSVRVAWRKQRTATG